MSIVAVNPGGSNKWSSDVIDGYPTSSPAVGPDGTVYFSADNNPSQTGSSRYGLYAINRLNGSIKWRFACGDSLTEPTFGADGTIYVGSNGSFYAINPNGSKKWQFSSSWESYGVAPQTTSPIIDSDGTIYFASWDGKIFALNPSGSVKWCVRTTHSINFGGGVIPALGLDGTLYAAGLSVMAVDLVDGSTQWNLALPGQVYGAVYIGQDGSLYLNSQGLLAVNSGSKGPAKSPWPVLYHDNQHTANYSYVQPKEITITADNKSVVYGGSLPPLTYKVSPSVTLKTAPTCVSSADGRSNVGAYPGAVTCSGGAADGYWINYAAGDMTVNKATLTVTADDKTMNRGGPLPALTAGYSGFVNGDTPSVLTGQPSLSTTATAASPYGQYPITVSQGTLQATNYTFHFVDGTLTVPGLHVDSPGKGGVWVAGTTMTIAWSFWGDPGSTVNIDLLKSGKVVIVRSIAQAVSSGSGGSGSYVWTIPSNVSPGTGYRVRVTSSTRSAFTALSDGTFTIKAISIAVTSPTGGETWAAGTTRTITWDYWGSVGSKVKIELLKGTAVVSTLAKSAGTGSDGTGSFTWTISPAIASGSDYRVRVTSTTNSAYTAESKKAFTINGASISVTSPAGGESWATGSKHKIRWSYEDQPGAKVSIQLLKKGKVVSTLAKGVSVGKAGTGSYSWTIARKLSSGSGYQVRVTSAANSYCTSTSKSFSITSAKASAGPDQEVAGQAGVRLSGVNSAGAGMTGNTYRWTQIDGPKVTIADPASLETGFAAPQPGKSLQFQLSITGADGSKSTDYCIVNVAGATASPSADAGPNRTVAAFEIVVLDGSKSSASDGSALACSWRQVSGVPVVLSDPSTAKPTFVSPEPGTDGASLVFELTVKDGTGLRSRDRCIVDVVASDPPPVARAGESRTVKAGSKVVLDASASLDGSDGALTFSWRQVWGRPVELSNPAAVKPVFTAPVISAPTEDLVFELTVTDSAGLQDKAAVVISVVAAQP